MKYDYQTFRPGIFTEEGVAMLRQIEATTRKLIKTSGAARAHECCAGVTDLNLKLYACLDYLVEVGVIKDIHGSIGEWEQDRFFVAGPNW